jgi:hypothetical protein
VRRIKGFAFICSIAASIILLGVASSLAVEVYIPSLKGKPGNTVDVPIVIDRVEQLAGIKLIINYDKEVLKFKEGNKTKGTQSLMHIINDRQPGRLVIVMAGAKGISGKDLAIMVLAFEIKKGSSAGKTTRIEIPEVQLMSESLKDIKAEIKAGSIAISP